MYRDNSLIPIEAMRIAALGVLAETPLCYADIAAAVRSFTSRVIGPSLDLMGSSVQVLLTERLIAPVVGAAPTDDPLLTLTEAGRDRLLTLLCAGLRETNTDLNRLVVALKMRFLYLLPPAERGAQIALLAKLIQAERTRYLDMQHREPGVENPLFGQWLSFELELLDERLRWLDGFERQAAAL